MQVLQLFYTSCESGLSSGKGFQTYSMSPGIRADERREIESLCGYRPPDKLPAQPTPEEISDLFPITFGCRQLQTGRYVVWQIKYLGQDYSGRYGNYFVHALVEEDLVELYLTHLTNYLQDNKKEVGWLDEFLVFYFNSPERPKTMTKNSVKTALLNLPKVYLDYLQSDIKARKFIASPRKQSFAFFMRELRKDISEAKVGQSGEFLSKLCFWKK